MSKVNTSLRLERQLYLLWEDKEAEYSEALNVWSNNHYLLESGVFYMPTQETCRYSWRDPLGRFGMTQFVDVGPETTIWTFDPLCWSTNLLLCKKNPICCFSNSKWHTLLIRVQQRINDLYDRPILLMWMTLPQINILDGWQILLIRWHRIINIYQLGRLDQVNRQIDFYSNQSSGRLKKCYEFAGTLTPRQGFQIHRQKFRPI